VALDEKLGIEIPEQDYGKTTMKSLLSISRMDKYPNLKNRIVKNISNHSFFGTKQNIMKILMYSIYAFDILSKMRPRQIRF
jgi:hypothetical protein